MALSTMARASATTASRWDGSTMLSAQILWIFSVPDGRVANQPRRTTTFRPPIEAPLSGARVSLAMIG